MYELKVTLAHIAPPIWRRLLVRGNTNLGFLHAVIQVAMGWTNSHLHQFVIDEQTWSDPSFQLNEFETIFSWRSTRRSGAFRRI